jgi:hypothetical protein
MTAAGLLGLDLLEADALQRIARRWGAPSAQPQTLERFLMTPLQVRRRLDEASADALEALTTLLESCKPSVPVEILPAEAVEELLGLLLVVVHAEDEPFLVALPDVVALAALELTQATPCRLPLLLHTLDEDQQDRLQATLEAALGPRALTPLEALRDPAALAAILHGLSPEPAAALRDLVDRGGLLDLDALADEPATWAPLRERGLLWETAHDARVPLETLQALLRLRLRREVHRAAVRWTGLRRKASRDNVRAFPASPLRALHEIVAALDAAPDRALPREALAEALHAPDPDGCLRLAQALDLLQDQQGRLHLTHGGADLDKNPDADQSVLQRLLMYLLDIPALPDAEAAARLLFGPDAPDDEPELPSSDLSSPSPPPDDEDSDDEDDEDDEDGGGDDHEWLDVMPPHLLDIEEATALHRYRGARALQLLRILLQQLLASLDTGSLVPRDDLDRVVEGLAAVTRTLHRLEGRPYLRALRAPAPGDHQRGVSRWLQSAALPLAWLTPHEDPPAEPDGGPIILSLFGDRPAPRAASPEGARALRVLAPAPAADAHARWFLRTLDGDDAAWLTPLLLGRGALDQLPGEPDDEDEPPADALKEALRALRAELAGPVAEMIDRLGEFLQGQTAARHLGAIQPADLRRFLLCWLPMDARARALPHLRAAFDALAALSRWSSSRQIALRFDAEALRRELEGPLLRTSSAEAAFDRYHATQPPPELLVQLPSAAHDGLAQVVDLSPDAGWFILETTPGRLDSRLRVHAAARPLGLLQRGDLLDAQCVHYGQTCWLTALRHIYLAQALPLLR